MEESRRVKNERKKIGRFQLLVVVSHSPWHPQPLSSFPLLLLSGSGALPDSGW
jgi:hypothetical protein